MTIPNWLSWPLFIITMGAALLAAGHALLSKRDPRAALGWVAACLFFPAIGPLFYYLFGINRIRTRARRLHADSPQDVKHRAGVGAPPGARRPSPEVERLLEPGHGPRTALTDLVRLGSLVTQLPLVGGNRLRMLRNGEEAFPAMLAAIESARHSVYLCTYLFESNATGRRFVEALARAVERGVRVRVLVDGVGELYGPRRISPLLRRARVPAARFLPPRLLPPQVNINLRNHRKILVVDRRLGFTGGMNIGDRHLAGSASPHRVMDVHFQVEGPIVRKLEDVFLDDWEFVTGESIEAGGPPEAAGDTWARLIADGPADEVDQISDILFGAVSSARRRVWIMSPYFVPPRELIAVLQSAVLRGVDVRVVLPGRNNVLWVHWASRNVLHEILEWGVRVWYQPAPFVHSKLLLVDDDYLQLGSANIDARSLLLNFELVMEVYDSGLAREIEGHFEDAFERSHELSPGELRERPLWARLRDATAAVFAPYL